MYFEARSIQLEDTSGSLVGSSFRVSELVRNRQFENDLHWISATSRNRCSRNFVADVSSLVVPALVWAESIAPAISRIFSIRKL